jgi:hypothetical protein
MRMRRDVYERSLIFVREARRLAFALAGNTQHGGRPGQSPGRAQTETKSIMPSDSSYYRSGLAARMLSPKENR